MDYSAFIYNSPIGKLEILTKENYLIKINFITNNSLENNKYNLSPLEEEIIKQLDFYFKGKLKAFNLPLNPLGTIFQLSVWKELQNVSYGTTSSYKEIAVKLDSMQAMRAVGNANSKNPIPIIIPCHRIIKSDGSIGGYSGGISKKKFLLDLEYKNK